MPPAPGLAPRRRRGLAAAAGVLLCLALPCPAKAQEFDPVALYKRCSPSVVTVTAVETVPRGLLNRTIDLLNPFPLEEIPGDVLKFVFYPVVVLFNGPLKAGGSGVIIDDSGRFVTNHHVITGSNVFWASTSDGRVIRARLLGSDAEEDFALLKMELKEGEKVVPAKLGSSEGLVRGEPVIAIGSPLRLGHTVSTGVVAGTDRRLKGPFQEFIQTDLTIGAGSSGGPLFNARGEVIGLTTLLFATMEQTGGVSCSVPIDAVKDGLDSLAEKGRIVHGFIGAHVKDVTPRLVDELKLEPVRPGGACVVGVGTGAWPESPASRAGLKHGDIIVKYGEKEIDRAHTLARAVLSTTPGQEVKVEFFRGQELLSRTIVVGRR